MHHILTCLFALVSVTTISAQSWVWSNRLGGNGYDEGTSVAVDAAGNSYITGFFQDTATFGSFQLISGGDNDVFIAKYDPSGNCLWAKKGSGQFADAAYAICVDNAGNAYIAGSYNAASMTFGSFNIAAAAWNDIFVVKYNSSGVEQWAVKLGGSQNDYAYGIVSDGANNVFITGFFQSSVTFGPNNLTSSGWGDIFVAKLDASNGACLWGAKGGSSGNDQGMALCIGGSNLYVTGFFRNSCTFPPLAAMSSTGGDDVFVGMIDQATGTWQWVKKGGGSNNDNGLGVTADGAGNCYVTGFYDGSATFGTSSFTSAGGHDVFLMKYDNTGNVVFGKSHGGWGNDHGLGIVRDAIGNLLLAGSFDGTTTFDANVVATTGITDIFVAKCDPANGTAAWLATAGAEDEDQGLGIGIDASNNVYVTGYFRSSCSFGSNTLNSNVFDEGFIAKLTYPLGTEEYGAGSLTLFPVPAKDQIEIRLRDLYGNYTVSLMNAAGELIRVFEMNHTGLIQLEDLNGGVYFINVRDMDGMPLGNAKFVKLN
ncbi:MAG: SBBP repeat-containing protein [Bacteroidia bacterium]|nr:SBBP repeat-containing protein [Bacteroidia bacterium]